MTTQREDAGQGRSHQQPDEQEDLSYDHDQDAEPTMSAPEEGRPDGLDALKDGGSGEGDGPE